MAQTALYHKPLDPLALPETCPDCHRCLNHFTLEGVLFDECRPCECTARVVLRHPKDYLTPELVWRNVG